jgi:integrase
MVDLHFSKGNQNETATGRTTDRRLAHPLHRAISRRGSADPSQPFNEGNEQALGVVWWPYIRADVGKLITQVTEETLGIAISPHLFRTAGATTASDAQSDMPYFASALLGHIHPRIADEHYKWNSSLNVQKDYAQLILTKYLGP